MRSPVNSIEVSARSQNSRPSVLVVDQDPGVRRLLRRELTAAGYHVQEVESGKGALRRVAERGFDLLILDLDSPIEGGPEAIRMVRELSLLPILALSARGEEDATAGALDVGADDFLRKPFGMKELLARARNALRRRALEQGRPAAVVSGDLEIDLLYRQVRLRGREVRLPPKSHEVLRVLAARAGKVLTHKELLGAVWGLEQANRVEYLRSAIRYLRSKLEIDPAHPRCILTEARVGYRLAVGKQVGQVS
jgi:two-component system, OmpR family, KDP operon response regulator KdpE